MEKSYKDNVFRVKKMFGTIHINLAIPLKMKKVIKSYIGIYFE